MRPTTDLTGGKIIESIREMLRQRGMDPGEIIEELEQVPAYERRRRGEPFGLREHVRGLLLSQFSIQQTCKFVSNKLRLIEGVFYNYDPIKLEYICVSEDTRADLIVRVKQNRCGNLRIVSQLAALSYNIGKMRAITEEFGSMDAFVVSDMPQSIIDRLSGTGRFGLKVVGVATAAEYLKNVGVAVGKPDTHLMRLLGPDRLALPSGEKEVIAVIDRIAKEIGEAPLMLTIIYGCSAPNIMERYVQRKGQSATDACCELLVIKANVSSCGIHFKLTREAASR